MKRAKRFLALLLVFSLFCSMSAITHAATITNSADVAGSDYTESTKMAKLLDNIFWGDIDIYSNSACTSEVYMPIGKAMSMDTKYWVKSKTSGNNTSGKQCYIYANAVYNKLFNEWVGHGGSFSHSETIISPGTQSISYALFKNSGVRCGAYMRTTGNSSGSFNGEVGHSLIILAYDTTNITYLEGNGDGEGMVRISIKTWSNFNYDLLTKKSRCVSHVVQPKNEYYDSLYPVCAHKEFHDDGFCTECHEEYDYLSDLDVSSAGFYKVTASGGINLREGPYQARVTVGNTVAKGTQVHVIGSVINHFGKRWYQVEVNGNKGYTHESHLSLVKYLDQSIVGSITDPVAGENIPQGKHPVAGTITSHNYPLKEVKAYIDGNCYATVTLGNTNSIDVRSTDINAKLSFSSLSLGKHTLTIKARDTKHSTLSTVCTVTFTIVCGSHSYTNKVTQAATCTTAGVRTYTCSKCGIGYTETIAATGHNHGSWVITLAPTCSANGSQKSVCSNCGVVKVQYIPATGTHSYGDWTTVQAPTCTAEGLQNRKCVNCSATESMTVAPTGHAYGGYITTKEPTCTEDGAQKSTCALCGDTKWLYPATTGHTYVSTVISATCVNYETCRYSCMKCGNTYDEQIGAVLGAHMWDSGVITMPASCGKEGIMIFTCGTCNQTKMQILAPLIHTYENDSCIHCGQQDPASLYKVGDINKDRKINSLDGLMLMRYLNGWNEEIAFSDAMDVNGDGKVNSLDGLILMRYLNGWDITFG